MLPDDYDKGASDSPSNPSVRRPRVVRGASDELFQNKLALVKRDIDPIIEEFPMALPSKNTAIRLAEVLRELFDLTEAYQEAAGRGSRKILEEFRRATIGASIAAKFLTEERPSIDRTTENFMHLQEFQRQLDALLRTYRA